MADDLAEALDRVLHLSGNDPNRAIEALSKRIVVREDSTTCSTVSSPTTTASLSSIPLPDEITPLPSRARSSPNKRPLPPPSFRKSKQQVYVLPAGSQLKITVPSETSRSKTIPSAMIQVTSDDSGETVDSTPFPVSRSKGSRKLGPPIRCNQPPPVDHRTVNDTTRLATRTLDLALPPALAMIQPEDSAFSFATFTSLQRSIAADPRYLGESHHILLRNPDGNTDKREMIKPPRNAVPPGKWYAVSCGSSVGLFLSWLETAPHVNGKTSAVHKSFRFESDAYLWLQVALLKGLVQLIN